MRFEEIKAIVGNIPYTTPQNGEILYKHILQSKPKVCLELGFAHGVSSCYIAAALQENGFGELHSVDLKSAKFEPTINDLLNLSKLSDYVKVYRENTSYTWFLKKQIEKQTHDYICYPLYDFCFIDGPKNWTIDGMAFFCVDKLLRENGWILFDDMDWKYINYSKPVCDGINIRELSDDEKATPHIRALFDLIVQQHPNYSNFVVMDNGWGWAQKIKSDSKSVNYVTTISFYASIKNLLKKVINKK